MIEGDAPIHVLSHADTDRHLHETCDAIHGRAPIGGDFAEAFAFGCPNGVLIYDHGQPG